MPRREFIQLVSVIAIAFGAGLVAFARHLDPPLDMANPAAIARSMDHNNKADRQVASMASGVGVAGITLGTLGLVIPWINLYMARQSERAGPQAT
jgi:hypothetical protein